MVAPENVEKFEKALKEAESYAADARGECDSASTMFSYDDKERAMLAIARSQAATVSAYIAVTQAQQYVTQA